VIGRMWGIRNLVATALGALSVASESEQAD
jgi:hypothetical protein